MLLYVEFMTLEQVDNGSSQIVFKRRALNTSVSNCIPVVFLWIKMGSPDKKASLLNLQINFIEYAAGIWDKHGVLTGGKLWL